jgi:hypothetical protein
MDELCDIFEEHIPCHDGNHEISLLNVSSNMTLSILSGNEHLLNSNQRYKKYLKYVDFSIHAEKGDIIIYMINDYLKHIELYNLEKSDMLILASKCKIIDKLILDLM